MNKYNHFFFILNTILIIIIEYEILIIIFCCDEINLMINRWHFCKTTKLKENFHKKIDIKNCLFCLVKFLIKVYFTVITSYYE